MLPERFKRKVDQKFYNFIQNEKYDKHNYQKCWLKHYITVILFIIWFHRALLMNAIDKETRTLVARLKTQR